MFYFYFFNTRGDLRLSVLLAAVLALGACAYDPADGAGSDRGEPQSKSSLGETRDLVVSERVVISSYPEKIRRLTILKGAVLATNGQTLHLEAEEIVSFGGVIDTTPFDPAPNVGASGLSGAFFHLSAKRGRGNLAIIAGGQNGGAGAEGALGDPGSKGSRGNNGEASYHTECLRLLFGGFFRDPGEGPGRCFKNWYCSRSTGNGGRGAQGGIGKPGLVGGDGGDTSPVLVELDDPSGIAISTELRPGLGGVGGRGGDGGPGGRGGDPGSRDARKQCREASRGAQGPQGEQGPAGSSGKEGERQPICLRLGTAEIGNCRDIDDLTQRGAQ